MIAFPRDRFRRSNTQKLRWRQNAPAAVLEKMRGTGMLQMAHSDGEEGKEHVALPGRLGLSDIP